MHVSGQMTSPVEGEGKRDNGGMSEGSRDRVTRGGMGIVACPFSWEFKSCYYAWLRDSHVVVCLNR